MSPITLDTASRALYFISPGDRDTWIRMGMALKAEFGDAARDTWMDWSAGADAFDRGAAMSSWKSFKSSGKVGIGSLLKEAKREGFVLDQADSVVSPEKLAADRKARQERDAKAEQDRQARAAAAAKRAQSQWRMAASDGTSPYLERKQVKAEACRFLPDGGIIIPMMRYDTEPPTMVGKQQINADGTKKYSGGMDKHSAMCRLGEIPVDGDVILIGEGYATGLSVRMAVDHRHPFFVAFDTSGLLTGAQILRAKYPSSLILFCADDDYLTGGKGLEKAQAAADAIGLASVLLPLFVAERRLTKDDTSLPMLTDFNDLHVAESLDRVRLHVLSRVEMLLGVAAENGLASNASPAPSFVAEPISPAPLDGSAKADVVGLVQLDWALEHYALVQGSTDVWDSLNKLRMKRAAFIAMMGKDGAKAWEAHTERRSISPRNLPKLVRGVAVASHQGGAGGDDIVMMLDRYTLLYPTKTVWDAEKKTIASYDAVALARGAELTARWLGHPMRLEKDLDKLVFDPTQRVDLNTHINMFEGFPLTPKKDEAKAELVLELLYILCSSEDNAKDVFEWVLRWLAYPLQHPGAKMQTALLFFGHKQGTGKSLFFEGIVKPIYGEHGATGGQHQLESTYTVWRSQKLYVLFEEILSRQDKYSHFGLVKHLITGRDTPISQKFKDDRTEANHLNCVMLSNEFQAVPLEPDDRRFLVVDVRRDLDPGLLAKIKAVLNDGLIEAFYAFLLSYPLGDFDPHTKPLMTDSKRRVIRFGLPAWESFYEAWSGGELDAPFCSCLSEDLYLVYDRWCNRYGERSMSMTKFGELMATRVDKSRQHVALGVGTKKLRTVFKVPIEEEESLSKQCQRFRDLADIKERA